MTRLTNLFLSTVLLASLSACETQEAAIAVQPSSIFAQAWHSGIDPDGPAFHVQEIDANTFVLRQSLRTSFEAPFLYLLI